MAGKINRLFMDIETSPVVSEHWQFFQTNISYESIRRHRAILTAAWQWEGEDEVEYTDQFKIIKREDDIPLIDDTANCNNLWHVLNERENTIVIMHNGDKFDLPIIKTHLLSKGFPQVQPLRTIDTLKIARRHFKFPSNRLDALGQYLGLGEKIETKYGLWQDVCKGDRQALKDMVEYNIQDIVLLEDVYNKLFEQVQDKSMKNQIAGPEDACPWCGTVGNFNKRGFGYNAVTKYQWYQCKTCLKYPRGPNIKQEETR